MCTWLACARGMYCHVIPRGHDGKGASMDLIWQPTDNDTVAKAHRLIQALNAPPHSYGLGALEVFCPFQECHEFPKVHKGNASIKTFKAQTYAMVEIFFFPQTNLDKCTGGVLCLVCHCWHATHVALSALLPCLTTA